ncbi:MAG TPA: SIMPL domain-containing protein [Anaerolineae bacterium]|nr:SIMPL domain-containing protein [Anaerolineae bacterium]
MFNSSSKWYFLVGGLTVLAIVAGVILSAIANASATSTQASETGSPRTITAVGTGSASASPDVATAQIGVETQSASPEDATRENEERMKTVVEALTAAGIDMKDIQTAYYSLWAEQRYDPEKGQPTGEYIYHVSNSLSVKIRALSKVGAILSEAVEAGANNISGVSFSIEDTSALEMEAREKAVADAKARAESLAQLSGVELGEVVLVSEVIGGPVPIVMERAMGGGGGVSIEPGQLEVSMQVQMSFAIQ